ncbi:hypothetical protein DQ354_18495 [Arthrobacter sp. AQ5-06]|nr:hypothetical protein DQ354_18495 [Arthrobacter sp. AQ5-06]
MGTAHHQNPADILSFIGHTLGFWPHESLVCIKLDANRVGATLRVDRPGRGGELTYARTVADYLAHDTNAASVLFAVYTLEPLKPGQAQPHAATIAALTGALAERGLTIREGLLVGDQTVSQYDGDPRTASGSPECHPIQQDQRRIRLPRQHHRTIKPNHPACLDQRNPHCCRRRLQIPEQTFYQWRTKHVGPPAYRIGRHLRISHSDFVAWLSQHAEH